MLFFAEAEHHAGLGDEALLLGDLQELQRAVILGLRADLVVEPRDGFDVVVEDFGLLVEDELQGVPVAAEIGDEDFDAGAGGLQADLADRLGPDRRAAVGQLVAVDAGDDDVLEVHRARRLRRRGGVRPDRASAAGRWRCGRSRSERVQTSPRIISVAVPAAQHSPMFGHLADWQTVCSF